MDGFITSLDENHIGPTASQPVQLNFITVAFHQFGSSMYNTYGILLLSITIEV